LILLARSGLVEHPPATTNALLVAGYWAALVIVMVRMCVYVAEVYQIATVPSVWRLRPGLLLVGTGIALAAGQTVWDAMQGASIAASAVLATPLVVLAVTTICVGNDLRVGALRHAAGHNDP
jgi:hypothetical protein